MKSRDRIQLVLFAISSIAYFPFSEWLSTTSIGSSLFLWGQIFYLIPLMVAVLSMPVFIVCLCFPSTRPHSLNYFLLSPLFILCCIGGIFLGQRIRKAGMESFAMRSLPLINAIKKYELDHSSPPASLNELVPNYLQAIPSTGMMAYPEYRYHTGIEAKEKYNDNPWAVSVFTPSGGINFDMMLYFPIQNYPIHGYGGSIERIAQWAYVHE